MTADVHIGLRCPKSEQYPFGWKKTDSIPSDEVCVVYLGGDGTTEDRKANGYAKIAQNDIKEALQMNIPVYGVTYDFNGHSKELARKIAFMKNRAATFLEENKRNQIFAEIGTEDIDESYLDKLYRRILAPRIMLRQKGKRLTAEEAARNIRKITFVTHCHGGYVAYRLEQKMQKQLKELGYSLAERKMIVSQMLVVAYAPACPLGVQQSSFYAFRSAYDGQGETGWNILPTYIRQRKREERTRFAAEQNNNTQKAAQNRWFELKPSYLEKKRLFLIKQKHPWLNDEDGPFMVNLAEHGDVVCGTEGQTKDGIAMMLMGRNTLVNGVKNALENKDKFSPLPSINELILESDAELEPQKRMQYNAKLSAIFKNMCENGKKFIAEAVRDLRTHNRE